VGKEVLLLIALRPYLDIRIVYRGRQAATPRKNRSGRKKISDHNSIPASP